jgi:hypothetical protein
MMSGELETTEVSDAEWLQALSSPMAEWLSPEDDAAYADL